MPKPAVDDKAPPVRNALLAPTGKGRPTDKLVLNYEQADLRVVVEELADLLGINLLTSTPITGTVTFKTDSQNSLMRRDIWPLFRLLLANAGLSLVQRGDFFEVTPVPVMPSDRSPCRAWRANPSRH